jgi:hypothetical protein
VGVVGLAVAALAVQALLVAVLVAVLVLEQLAGARRRRRGEASPLESLEAPAGA